MYGYHLIHIHEALKELESSIHALSLSAQAHEGVLWTPEGERTDRRALIGAISQIYNTDDWSPPSAGLIHLHPDGVAHAGRVNSAKIRFEETIGALKRDVKSKGMVFSGLIERAGAGVRDPQIAEALQAIQSSRLNLLWAYRKIRILPVGLLKISWTLARQRSIVAKTDNTLITAGGIREQLDEMQVSDKAKEGARINLEKLDPNELLAKVKPVRPHLRANIVWADKDGNKHREAMITPTALVLQDNALPEIKWPASIGVEGGDDTKLPRGVRSDHVVTDEPYITSLGLHRYDPPRYKR